MVNDWINDNGVWYYFKANGAMSTGWVNDNGIWYYFDTSGAMLTNTTVDGYVLGANGAWIK
jgi:glucan-binding YG repeat protein